MKKMAVCFTKRGREVIERLNYESKKRGLSGWEAFAYLKEDESCPGFRRVTTPVDVWAKEHFGEGKALLFVGAAGIAVRALTNLPKDKLRDGPVLVADDRALFVIPILSGHAGGANKLAFQVAELLHAVPVITTSTDVNGAFSADVFAAENSLMIRNREGIRKVSVKALEGKPITLSIRNYPPEHPVDIVVADETDAECSLLLSPKPYTVGIGMKKNKNSEEAERFFLKTLEEAKITIGQVYAICTIDRKEDEEAIRALRDKYSIPVLSFDKELLMKAKGNFHGSAFVYDTVGADNVCERAAVLGSGSGGKLIVPKKAEDGMTIKNAKRM